MMVAVVSEHELAPTAYPAAPEGLSDKAMALDSAMVWQRIEAYVAYRWSARDVLFVVEGPGEWVPRLAGFNPTTTEIWKDGWQAVTLSASPLGGFELVQEGPYRVSGSIADNTVPAVVLEAYSRLAEYLGGGCKTTDEPGVSEYSFDLGGRLKTSISRNPAFAARAMQWSGAADLLRPYRRVS